MDRIESAEGHARLLLGGGQGSGVWASAGWDFGKWAVAQSVQPVRWCGWQGAGGGDSAVPACVGPVRGWVGGGAGVITREVSRLVEWGRRW